MSKSKKSNFDLEGEYRKFVCNKMFAEIGVSDCTKFMYYVNQVDLVKKEDEKLCSVLKDFWRELVLINPRLSKLLNLMAIVTKSIHLLNTEYSKLLSTFTKSTEVLYYYSTLLENVLSDSQKSLELTNKKNFLEKFLLQNSRINKKLTFFDDNNGIFIISWEKQAIGKILYANSKSANILCLPMEELVGMNMQNFIPPPYDHNFNENVYHYLNRTTKSDLILPRQIYLMIQNGCLVECDFNASLTFMFNRLVIVVVIRERKTTHQVALIDENLEILAHTQRFSDFFGMRSKDLRGSIMYSIIPELEYVCLLPFCPLILSIENVDVQLVSCYREICGKRIDYVILMNDPEEIQA